MRMNKTGLVMMLLAAVFTGCSATPPAEEPLPIQAPEVFRIGYSLGWVTNLELAPRNQITRAALLDDMLLTVETPANLVSCISVRDGRVQWRRVVGSATDQLFEPYRFEDRIVINSETTVYELELSTGRLLRQAMLAVVVNDRPAVLGSLALYGGLNGRIFAHDLHSAFSKWAYQMTSSIVVQPVMSGGNVFVADSSGVYAMLSGPMGDLIWKGRTFGRISARPVTNPLGVFVPSEDQTLYALQRATGRDLWKYPAGVPLTREPHLFRNTLLLPVPGKEMVALDARSGQTLWTSSIDATPVHMTENRLYLFDHRSIHVLDPATGRSTLQVPVRDLFHMFVGQNETFILITDNGRIIRLDARL